MCFESLLRVWISQNCRQTPLPLLLQDSVHAMNIPAPSSTTKTIWSNKRWLFFLPLTRSSLCNTTLSFSLSFAKLSSLLKVCSLSCRYCFSVLLPSTIWRFFCGHLCQPNSQDTLSSKRFGRPNWQNQIYFKIRSNFFHSNKRIWDGKTGRRL